MNNSYCSSIDDEDEFDFYSNPAAQYNKIKQQKEKEIAMQKILLEQSFDDEDKMNESLTKEHSKEESPSKTTGSASLEDTVIEITDSQSPKNNFDETYEEIPTNRRATRSSTRRGRGCRKAQTTSVPTVTRKRNSRKNSLDKEFEELEQVASTLRTVSRKNLTISNEQPVLIDSDNECDESEDIVNVKVLWRHGEPHSFPIMKKKDLASIYEFFAKRENVSIKNILLSKNEKVLSPHCTPLSIEYKVTDILEGGILQDGENKQPSKNQQDKNSIEVKVQQKNVKKPLLIQLHKSNDMNILAKKVAAELGIEVEKLKFNFDGDTLDLEETVDSLALEGGECFDLAIMI